MTDYVSWQKRDDAQTKAERGIVRELIRNLLSVPNYAVAIDNGGDDFEVDPSRSAKKLFEGVALADGDTLVVFSFNPETRKVTGDEGFVQLYIGGGNMPCEIIADYSTNLEELIAPALERAEKTESRF